MSGNDRCRVTIPLIGKFHFQIKLGEQNYSEIKLRVCVHQDEAGKDILSLSSPFRAVRYKLRINPTENFPEPEGKYYYEDGEKILRFKVSISPPLSKLVILKCDLYTASGEHCNSAITKPTWGSSWWQLESGFDIHQYVSLPTTINFGCKNSIHSLICIRVSVLSVMSVKNEVALTSACIGAAQTTTFSVFSKHPDTLKRRYLGKISRAPGMDIPIRPPDSQAEDLKRRRMLGANEFGNNLTM